MNTSTFSAKARRGWSVLVLGMVTLCAAHANPSGAEHILGRWHGESICVKAAWNAACNDEIVLYDFVPSADKPGKITVHASKYVTQVPQPMGDLDFDYDREHDSWSADFANTRVSIRWRFEIKDGMLVGQVIDLKEQRVARNAQARRMPAGGKP